jgi:hypothetical protein
MCCIYQIRKRSTFAGGDGWFESNYNSLDTLFDSLSLVSLYRSDEERKVVRDGLTERFFYADPLRQIIIFQTTDDVGVVIFSIDEALAITLRHFREEDNKEIGLGRSCKKSESKGPYAGAVSCRERQGEQFFEHGNYYEENVDPFDMDNAANWDGDEMIGFR